VAVCFQWVCDTPRTPDWQEAIAAVEVLERDGDGRTSLVAASIDAMVTHVELNLRLTYEQDRTLHMERESGDLKHLTVTWVFQDLGDGRTHASFQTEFDPGRVLSLLAKGPLFTRLEALLTKQPPEGLRQALEAGAA
jgi:ribosome-associated toxin RatA of RatAB toxin-antitoxin module